jgi:hypothetical protein
MNVYQDVVSINFVQLPIYVIIAALKTMIVRILIVAVITDAPTKPYASAIKTKATVVPTAKNAKA